MRPQFACAVLAHNERNLQVENARAANLNLPREAAERSLRAGSGQQKPGASSRGIRQDIAASTGVPGRAPVARPVNTPQNSPKAGNGTPNHPRRRGLDPERRLRRDVAAYARRLRIREDSCRSQSPAFALSLKPFVRRLAIGDVKAWRQAHRKGVPLERTRLFRLRRARLRLAAQRGFKKLPQRTPAARRRHLDFDH